MERLTEEQALKLNTLRSDIKQLQTELNTGIEAFNALQQQYRGPLEEKAQLFQQKYEELHTFLEELASEMGEYYDEGNSEWQESEAGEAYQDWQSNYIQAESEMQWTPEVPPFEDTADFETVELGDDEATLNALTPAPAKSDSTLHDKEEIDEEEDEEEEDEDTVRAKAARLGYKLVKMKR